MQVQDRGSSLDSRVGGAEGDTATGEVLTKGQDRYRQMPEGEQETGYIFDTSRSDEREQFVTERLREFSEQRRRIPVSVAIDRAL